MNPFRYERAANAGAALSLASAAGNRVKYIAGGTNLLDLMKIDIEHPAVLVDINRLPLAAIERRRGALHIGALARLNDVAAHPLVRAAFPMIAIALEQSASPQLRNMATMGGNLLQRTRCPYFRDVATACNKRLPGSGCSAIGGANRMEAILGTSEQCIATHPSDVAVALAALDAIVEVSGAGGVRAIALHDFYRQPGTTPDVETTLARGELITGITIPDLPFAARSTYVKVRDRAQYEFALASSAAALDVKGGTILAARLALGGVGTVPWRAAEAERELAGKPATRASFESAAETALHGARGYGENDFKIVLAKRTVVRALEAVSA